MTHAESHPTTLGHFSSGGAPVRRRARSVGSVLAGLLTIFAVTTATDVALHLAGVFPPIGQPMSSSLLLIATAYRVVYGILGCYVAARIAPDRPMRHALVLGGVGVLVSTAGAVAFWDLGAHWYPLAVIAMSLPCAWAGGRIAERRSAS